MLPCWNEPLNHSIAGCFAFVVECAVHGPNGNLVNQERRNILDHGHLLHMVHGAYYFKDRDSRPQLYIRVAYIIGE